jgi:CubicO group peptidase (beta-lactamase class C family)
VRRFILDTMRILGAPGAAIAVRKDGKLIWSEGFGYADLEQQVPVTALTRFRVGSVSKPLTSAALGLLSEAGKLDWDASLPTGPACLCASAVPERSDMSVARPVR